MTQDEGGTKQQTFSSGSATVADTAGEPGGTDMSATAGVADAEASPTFGPVAITPADQQYRDLVRGLNQRYIGHPESVQLVDSPNQIVGIVQRAVINSKRITVRSGGHCFADFVFNPSVHVVVDVSKMNAVYFDSTRNAFVVESGATVLSAYEKLYQVWGVTIPAGICYSVGMGGHISGGGWGMLCRQHGLVIDHLYAVEVVVVDAAGHARAVVATREDDDPNRDLWWAHTGGGGGNFGVVTRYWFRSPGATGNNPSTLLPKPPAEVLLSAISFPWNGITQREFVSLVKNYGGWHAAHKAPDDPYRVLCTLLYLNHKSNGQIGLITQVDATVPNAQQLLDSYFAELLSGVDVQHGAMTTNMGDYGAMPEFAAPRRLPWLEATRYLGTTNSRLNDPTFRGDYKSAYMRSNFRDNQVETLYKHLTRTDFDNPAASVLLSSFGGQINAVAQNATASAHRDAAFKMLWTTWWNTPAEDDQNLRWIRQFYSEVFASTGGVPVPNTATDGCYINYPDIDLSDPKYNKSSAPWHGLYYKDNYPRLQQVKAKWDPRNIFRHKQSIQLPSP